MPGPRSQSSKSPSPLRDGAQVSGAPVPRSIGRSLSPGSYWSDLHKPRAGLNQQIPYRARTGVQLITSEPTLEALSMDRISALNSSGNLSFFKARLWGNRSQCTHSQHSISLNRLCLSDVKGLTEPRNKEQYLTSTLRLIPLP